MTDDKMKWVCTFALMGFIAWWAHNTVMVTYRALAELQAVNVMEVAGASGLLGSLVTLLTLTIQHSGGLNLSRSFTNALRTALKGTLADK